MSQWQPFPIVGGSYKDDTRPWSVQDTINMIPVAAEKQGTRSPSILRCAPGFAVFSASAQSAPCRGLHNVEGTLFGVIGDKLYTFALDGTATALGTIPGVERVSMAHNQIANGNQLAIAANNSGYVYDTVLGTLTQIADEGFPGSIAFAFIDQYIVGIDPSRNFAFNSMLADAKSYNTLDRMQAEAQPDKLVGLAVTHDELWLFGERTIQPFHDTGAAEAPFEAGSNMVVEVGCASRDSIRNMDNSVFWLGNDGIVYRANGYAPQRISTHAVEQAVSRCNRNGAFAFTFEGRGHKVYYLTFPDGQTWGYDAASDEWHRRQSYGLDRWRINDLVYWNRHWIGGDYANGRLYVLSWDCQQEDGRVFERRRILGPVADNQNAIIVNGMEIVANVGEKPGLSAEYVLQGPFRVTGGMPDAAVGDSIEYQYGSSGGVPPVVFTTTPLPPALSMDAGGNATGTATTGGTYNWTVTGTDAAGRLAELDDSARVVDAVTWDPAKINVAYTSLSAANLVATNISSAGAIDCGVGATLGREASTANHYFEVKFNQISGNGADNFTGIALTGSAVFTSTFGPGRTGDSWGYRANGGLKMHSNTGAAYGPAYVSGDIVGVLVKNGKLYFSKNGVWVGDPVAETGYAYGGITGICFPSASTTSGQTPSEQLTGAFRASQFAYAPPAGSTGWVGL